MSDIDALFGMRRTLSFGVVPLSVSPANLQHSSRRPQPFTPSTLQYLEDEWDTSSEDGEYDDDGEVASVEVDVRVASALGPQTGAEGTAARVQRDGAAGHGASTPAARQPTPAPTSENAKATTTPRRAALRALPRLSLSLVLCCEEEPSRTRRRTPSIESRRVRHKQDHDRAIIQQPEEEPSPPAPPDRSPRSPPGLRLSAQALPAAS